MRRGAQSAEEVECISIYFILNVKTGVLGVRGCTTALCVRDSGGVLEQAKALIGQSVQIAVLTGAGISTDSGIPDFRGPNGLWRHDDNAKKASHISTYTRDPEVRAINWQHRADGDLWANVAPNAGHRALVQLERQGKLSCLITQNVDGLHQMAGSSPEVVIEVHGTTRQVMCLDCDYRDDIEVVLDRVRAGEPDPRCGQCGGILKSATVSFGQNLDRNLLARAQEAAASCEVFMAIGTSLEVFPINETVQIASRFGAEVIIVNGEPTAFDSMASLVVRGEISELLPQLVEHGSTP